MRSQTNTRQSISVHGKHIQGSEQCKLQKRVKQSKQTHSNINPSSISPMIMTHCTLHAAHHNQLKLDARQDDGQVEQLLGRDLGFLTSKSQSHAPSPKPSSRNDLCACLKIITSSCIINLQMFVINLDHRCFREYGEG